MTTREADKIAKERYGPTASAIRRSDPSDRHNRFGIAFVAPGGYKGKREVVIAGYGDCFESAYALADINPAAIAQLELVKDVKAGRNEAKSISEYFEEAKKQIEEQTGVKEHGNGQAEERDVDGSSGEGVVGRADQEE